MATEKDREAPPGRVVLLIALLGLSAFTAVAFGRVFQGHGASARLFVAAVSAVLLAGAMERRHVLLAALVSAAGLLMAISLLLFPGTTKLLLPTLSTLRAANEAIHAVGRTAATEVPPALPFDSLVLAALIAMWTAAFASHSLASRARSPFLSLLPPAALVAFASIVMQDGGRPAYVVGFLAASFGVLFADGLRRVGQWGPVTIWHGRRHLRFGSTTNTRGARTVAAFCLGFAVIAPWILPGFHAGAVLDVRGAQSPVAVHIDPIVDIRPRLLHNPPVRLFTVSSPRPAYWRFLSLDRFDGKVWSASDLEAKTGLSLTSGPLASNVPHASTQQMDVVELQQRFTFDRLSQMWLPAAYNPTSISVPRGSIRYNARTQLVVTPNGTYPGFTYDVVSTQVVPSPEALDAVTSLASPLASQYTVLPKDTPPQILQIAHRLTDDQPTIYSKILKIQNYLRGFRYDERVPPGHDANHILFFLTKLHAGYCEQFAGTMAVLLRSLGIPARVAVGFTQGLFNPRSGLWTVTTQQAHAWVEVLFPGYGWLAFEPTPTRNNPVAQPYVQPAGSFVPTGGITSCPAGRTQGTGACEGRGGDGATSGNGKGGKDPATFDRAHGDPLVNGSPGARFEATPARSWPMVALMFGLLAVAVTLMAIPGAKLVRRRLALSRARSPGDRVLAAYHNLLAEAADLGVGRRPHETPWEYRIRLNERINAADGDGHLDRLTGLAGRAAYSERAISPDQATQAVAAAQWVMAAIRASTAFARRVLGRFRIERLARPA
jgi:transglutaminase TgpA-like protein/transglutaminase superfamily protein/uncharacterized protein DUF4129